jgi:hypothetical protein
MPGGGQKSMLECVKAQAESREDIVKNWEPGNRRHMLENIVMSLDSMLRRSEGEPKTQTLIRAELKTTKDLISKCPAEKEGSKKS